MCAAELPLIEDLVPHRGESLLLDCVLEHDDESTVVRVVVGSRKSDSPAVKFKDGFGNPCNNGVRNYAKINGELYLGTTSWCNLGEDSGLEYYKYEGSNR